MTLSVSIKHKLENFALDINFDTPHQGLTALFGPSGAGKSLTINALAGLMTPQEGTITINDQLVFCSKKKINVPPHKRRIGYVFQDARLFPHLSVDKNIRFGVQRAATKPTSNEIKQLIELLEIDHLLDRYPSNLSGGEKHRVAIARALLSDPVLLLLDEPTAALDQQRRNEFLSLLETIRDQSKIPILLVSHSIHEVARLSDKMVIIDNGSVIAKGSADELLTQLDLVKFTGIHESGSLLTGIVQEHNTAQNISIIDVKGTLLYLPSLTKGIGSSVRVRIRSSDVMLSLSEPIGISANNVFPGKIENWRCDDGSKVLVRISCFGSKLLCCITLSSWERLGLHVGMDIYCIIKSILLIR